MISQGEYSDYEVLCLLRILKDCDLQQLREVFIRENTEQRVTKTTINPNAIGHWISFAERYPDKYILDMENNTVTHKWTYRPGLYEFCSWLEREKYAEEIEHREVHWD